MANQPSDSPGPRKRPDKTIPSANDERIPVPQPKRGEG
jgi:hypothetical protein